MVTSEPVRDRIAAFTRSISLETRSMRRSIEADWGLSNGTMTANRTSPMEGPANPIDRCGARLPHAQTTGLRIHTISIKIPLDGGKCARFCQQIRDDHPIGSSALTAIGFRVLPWVSFGQL